GSRSAFDAKAVEMVRSRGDHHTIRDLEWCGEPLAGGHEVEFEPVAALQPAVDRRHEVAVALPTAGEPGDVNELILPEALADVQRTDGTLRPRLPIETKISDVDAGTRDEAERRIEGVADTLVLERHVPEIIGIVDLESGCSADSRSTIPMISGIVDLESGCSAVTALQPDSR